MPHRYFNSINPGDTNILVVNFKDETDTKLCSKVFHSLDCDGQQFFAFKAYPDETTEEFLGVIREVSGGNDWQNKLYKAYTTSMPIPRGMVMLPQLCHAPDEEILMAADTTEYEAVIIPLLDRVSMELMQSQPSVVVTIDHYCTEVIDPKSGLTCNGTGGLCPQRIARPSLEYHLAKQGENPDASRFYVNYVAVAYDMLANLYNVYQDEVQRNKSHVFQVFSPLLETNQRAEADKVTMLATTVPNRTLHYLPIASPALESTANELATMKVDTVLHAEDVTFYHDPIDCSFLYPFQLKTCQQALEELNQEIALARNETSPSTGE